MEKVCSNCNINKKYEYFSKDLRNKSGIGSVCIECKKKLYKKYYIKNKNKILKKNKEWLKNNKEKYRHLQNEFRKKNKEINKEISKNNNELKKCSKCKKIKQLDFFYKNNGNLDGMNSSCKECCSIESKKYYKKNKIKILEKNKEWSTNNKEKHKKSISKWAKENKDKRAKIDHNYYMKNKKEIRIKEKEKLNNNIQLKIKKRFSNLVYNKLKNKKLTKEGKSTFKNILPYTLEDLMNHLELQFEDGMTWDNYGEWHIDHKTPDSWFDYNSTKDEGFKKSWALENLQPMWASENLSKGNRYKA